MPIRGATGLSAAAAIGLSENCGQHFPASVIATNFATSLASQRNNDMARRLKGPADRYIPKGAVKVAAKDSEAVAYVYERAGKFLAIFYRGNAAKCVWHFQYAKAAQREAKLVESFKAEAAVVIAKAVARAERAAWVSPYKVGDVFKSSWGYDQTNVDYYECVAVRGKHLIVREIASEGEENGAGGLAGRCVPIPGKFIGEEKRYLAQPCGFKVASFAWARFLEPLQMVGGKAVYPSAYWSAYA